MCLNDLRKKNPVTNVKTSGGDIRTKKHQIKGISNIWKLFSSAVGIF